MSADVDRLAETVRRCLDTNAAYATPEHLRLIADAKAALDGLVLAHTRQEEALRAARPAIDMLTKQTEWDTDLECSVSKWPDMQARLDKIDGDDEFVPYAEKVTPEMLEAMPCYKPSHRELLALLSKQEEALRTIVVFSEGAAGAIYRAESMREVALAALSPSPVASGENAE